MTSPLRSLWNAPAAVPPPPRRVWRDWVLVGVLVPLVLVEAALRPEVPWRWAWAAVLVLLLPTLLWRRTRPFTMLAVAFGTGTAFGLVTGGDPQLYTTAYVLLPLYAVMRWGSGRSMLGGGALVLAGWAMSLATGPQTLADAIGGLAVVVTVTSLGLAFRWRAGARARELDRMRLLERETLARDLHDTVAHHVSAIAIQAQAGLAVADAQPDAAAAVLRTIESEASRTLDEMRAMVRVLRRDGEPGELAPAPAAADLRGLATPVPGAPGALEVAVVVDDDLDGLPPAIGGAVFRLAQEAVTNARRHATGATRVDVLARVDDLGVHLEVRDDGAPAASAHSARAGYGITGMIERATLLGGTCEVGPVGDGDGSGGDEAGAKQGGWRVSAHVPRTAWAANGRPGGTS
ncbi:sensor histidine kinase [Agromyces sp. NPDC058110]|uniref:sensor histidine kinase n=1 Tax=Agromyces sp. NPDC058110 TaxID=3346345 RepID=UPI0036D9F3D7